MKIRTPSHIGLIVLGSLFVLLIAIALWPRATSVDLVTLRQEPFEHTIEADGIVQARERFVVAMPTTGVLERLQVEAGNPVVEGQVLGYIIPPEIDARQKEQALAHLRSLEEAVRELEQQVASVRPLVEQAQRRSARLDRLVQSGAVSREQTENAADAYRQLRHQAEALLARQQAMKYEVQAAASVLAARPGQRMPITAPVSGIVLRRHEQSERSVMAGTPIVEIGDTAQMEVLIDVLSIDAVKIKPGMPVHLDGWGGGRRASAIVRRVEPSARTKVSSLGIEEQRVNIVADLVDRPAALGDGYRVEASVVIQHFDSVLCVPLGALLRRGNDWGVFVNQNGRARLATIKIEARNAFVASVLNGLNPGQSVIVHPPESLQEGDRIQGQQSSP